MLSRLEKKGGGKMWRCPQAIVSFVAPRFEYDKRSKMSLIDLASLAGAEEIQSITGRDDSRRVGQMEQWFKVDLTEEEGGGMCVNVRVDSTYPHAPCPCSWCSHGDRGRVEFTPKSQSKPHRVTLSPHQMRMKDHESGNRMPMTMSDA